MSSHSRHLAAGLGLVAVGHFAMVEFSYRPDVICPRPGVGSELPACGGEPSWPGAPPRAAFFFAGGSSISAIGVMHDTVLGVERRVAPAVDLRSPSASST
jgi:hypothetical protein